MELLNRTILDTLRVIETLKKILEVSYFKTNNLISYRTVITILF